jgi:hypothetical protein
MSWPVSPRGEHNDFDPPIDAEPAPEETEAERRISDHQSRCAACSTPKDCPALARLIDEIVYG